MKSLDERLDSFAEGWRPEPGDKVIGTIVDLDETDGGYGSYPVITIETDDGNEIAVHGFHTVLKNELAKKRPKVGDRIGVVYLGKTDGKNYEGYRVVIERDEAGKELDWDRIGEAAESELQEAGIADDSDATKPVLDDKPTEDDDDQIPF